MTLIRMIRELAKNHNFDLDVLQQALFIKAVRVDKGYTPGGLVLAVWNDKEERYAVGRIVFSNGREQVGFTCWLSPGGSVVRAVNDFRSNIADLEEAEQEMVELIGRLYLESGWAELYPLP